MVVSKMNCAAINTLSLFQCLTHVEFGIVFRWIRQDKFWTAVFVLELYCHRCPNKDFPSTDI